LALCIQSVLIDKASDLVAPWCVGKLFWCFSSPKMGLVSENQALWRYRVIYHSYTVVGLAMIRCFIFSQWFPHLELRNHLVFNTKELRWRSHSPAGSPDILDLVRCIVEEPWSEGCETLAVVYLEHLIAGFWQQQVAQFAAAGDVRGAYGMPRSNRYVAVAALGIVALHALGAENCLLLAVYCRCSIPPGTSIPI